MTTKERYREVIDYFSKSMPTAESELNFRTPFELLVAVVLSAQCTDKRVNLTTPALFERYPTPFEMAQASEEDIFHYIKSISYPNNKAKHLATLSRQLVEKFGGEVPSDPKDLESLQGVGRKTANVVLAEGFGVPRIAVDTHVFRVANRIGLTDEKDVTATEEMLMKRIPEDRWIVAHHLLIFHGRKCCRARKPSCTECGLEGICIYDQLQHE
jgi:endonuclease-3